MKRMKRIWASVAVVLAIVAARPAVGAESSIVIHWRGTAAIDAAYQQSHLKQVMAHSQVRDLLTTTLKTAEAKLAAEADPDEAAALLAMRKYVQAAIEHPTVFWLDGKTPAEGEQRDPSWALLSQTADGNTAELREALNALLEAADGPGAKPELFQRGDIIGLTFGQAPPVDTLFGDKAIHAGAAKLMAQPALTATVDVQRLLSFAKADAEAEGMGDQMQQSLDFLGLEGVRYVHGAMGFEGANWATAMHIDAPAPRKGLAKMLDGNGALAADTFALVPRSAVLAGAATIELPPIYDMIHDWAVNSDNMDPAQWQDVERRVQGLLGVPPRQFLDALGPDWVWYGDAQIGGSSPLGMVMVNRLDEPATVEAALGQVIMIANSMLTFAKPMPEMQFSIRRQMWGEATMFYASVPGVAPTIMVHDGRLYIGLYPQTVVSAAALHDRNAPSILTSPKFQQVQRAVLPAGRQLDEAAAAPRVQSFSYVDVRQASVSGYSMLLMVTRYVQGTADIFGLNTPPLLIPPLHAMQGQLQPAGAMTWADEAGWHYKSVTPFPGALMMAAQTNLSVGQAALAAGILLPAINRAREIASRTASGANLRALGQAVFVYEAQHGRYPDHVAPLILDGTITPMLLIVPGEPMPDTPDYEAKEAAWRKWVDQHSDYVYLGMSDKTPAGDVVAYEKFDPKNPPEGLNILYGDGHVEWHHYEGAKEELRRAGVIGGGDE